jgi:N-methylhydantoinase B/oxoprolinase/acetone carboxylase alpha subunit
VTKYVSQIGSLLNDTETRNVTVHGTETPQMGISSRVAAAGQYISNYVGPLQSGRTFSNVEQDAVSEVNNALVRRMGEIFG